MDFHRGKSITTSVPSMSFRFNANAEEIEEIYASEEEQNETNSDATAVITTGNSELESSPRRLILPLLGKRTPSIDTNISTAQDASPPSDPWRFLSDIKGKITKSVEGKFTEYKAKGHDGDGSPKQTKNTKDSKENSSLSDSEEVSESSISKTCGIVSTTEGVEMSSDDDETPSLSEKDKLSNEAAIPSVNSSSSPSLRQRFRIISKSTVIKEGSVSTEFLENVQKVNQSLGSADSEIESGIDVLAEMDIANFHVDDNDVLSITQVTGDEIQNDILSGKMEMEGKTIFNPVGFVDLRVPDKGTVWFEVVHRFRYFLFILMILILYIALPLTVYLSGFVTGVFFALVLSFVYIKFFFSGTQSMTGSYFPSVMPIVEIPAVKEHLPLKKYEGWVNEYPEKYDPHTYHVSQTQSVYLRLQGNFLRISHGRQRIPKRAMWNEPEHKLIFTNHRMYNLCGAKISLLPEGLAKVRHWSKKYPICITLSVDQVSFEYPERIKCSHKNSDRKKELEKAQVYSKLASEEEELQMSNIDAGFLDPMFVAETDGGINITFKDSSTDDKAADMDEEDEGDEISVTSWHDITHTDNSEITQIYIFTRTGREKEEWFRRLKIATYKMMQTDETSQTEKKETDQSQSPTIKLEEEYLKFMNKMSEFVAVSDDSANTKNILIEEYKETVISPKCDKEENASHWINAFIGRVMFDSLREHWLQQRIKERLQRKLTSVKLPYFIQELYCEELKLGNASPYISKSKQPVLNSRGLWIDLDVNYEGSIVITLQTKLDLMKLKQPHGLEEKYPKEKSAIFHSDVDDSAESSTDEDSGHRATIHSSSLLDSSGYPVTSLASSSTKSKKLMKMVDRITESKLFQAASDMKYIRKAMEGVSNTDLRLKVEMKKCAGTLVINIPPPPSDRVWLGFRVPPELLISAYPIVGERNINLNRVMSWIEKKIYKEFQKLLVFPNMEDFLIPVMTSKLPE